MIFGFFDMPWWGYVVLTLILTHITVICVSLYLHRAQAHRAMDLHPAVCHFFRFWLWLTTGMVTKEWVAIHRKHHATCETEEDPHSPQIFGIKKVFFEGAELYRDASKDQACMEKYSHGVPDDWVERHVYAPYNWVGVSIMLIINLLCFGVLGLTIWAVQMMWIPIMAAGVINGIGHYWGYRNFESKDASRNVMPWGILAGGEELHNNHHAFGTSAKFSVKWWEFDIGWAYITILKFFGLAKVRKTIPSLYIVPDKTNIDIETLKAFVNNRMQILADYYKDVIAPVVNQEMAGVDSRTKQFLDKAKQWLKRDDSLINQEAKNHLLKLLNENTTLKQVYTLKQQLQTIWTKTTASQKELIDSLQEWCKHAENTGIVSLKNFAQKLKAYSLSLTPT